jgi:hypoxanthine-DNA glycosylase
VKTALPPIVNLESSTLILGSMPGEKSLELQQYYGNRGNSFWRLMFTIFNEAFSEDYEKRKQLLYQNGIAVWDVLSYCEREGSVDSKIKNEASNEFSKFFAAYPNITTVFFSSKAAAGYYDKYNPRLPYITYIILPSPSGANAGKSFSQKLEEWFILKDFVR